MSLTADKQTEDFDGSPKKSAFKDFITSSSTLTTPSQSLMDDDPDRRSSRVITLRLSKGKASAAVKPRSSSRVRSFDIQSQSTAMDFDESDDDEDELEDSFDLATDDFNNSATGSAGGYHKRGDDEDGDYASGKKKRGRPPKNGIAAVPRNSAPRPPKQSSSSAMTHIPYPDGMFLVEKILYYRPVDETVADSKEEFLCKFKNRSYMHAEWLARQWVEDNDKRGKQKIKHFLEKTIFEPAYALLNPERGFSENYIKIDRIISVVRGLADPDALVGADVAHNDYYLVKWKSLQYENCTWETEDDLVRDCDDAEEQIAAYHRRNTLPHLRDVEYYKNCIPPGVRPPPNMWQKMEESPVYKDENTLRAYQLEGLNWLLYCWHHSQSSLIADEMGLGKTVQSIAFLNELNKNKGVRGPFLIIAPLSTIPHWERTVNEWTDLNAVVFHGSASSRNIIQTYEYQYTDPNGGARINLVAPPEMISKTNVNALRAAYNQFKFDIMITTYEMCMSAPYVFKNAGLWRCVVVDEAHRLKNKSSKVGEILKSFSFEHRLLLTGTPIQNSLEELWSILNFLDVKKFPDGTEKQFLADYNLQSAADVQRLQGILKPLMLRRLKEDVETSIPVKEETIIEVELTDIQRAYYRAILERNFSFLKQGAAKKNNVPNLINTMMELRKCCIHPYLIRGAEEKILMDNHASTSQENFGCMVNACGKFILLNKLLPKLKQGGHRVLIFSQMTKCLDLLGDYLLGSGYKYERIDGGIRGEARQQAIDRFSAPDSDIFVFLLCTRAGGVGINLTAADTCIIFDSDWNPQNDLQAQARCHRIGQKKDVKIYRLITRNTYERTMFDKAGMKLGLDRAVLSKMDFDMSEAGGSGGAPSSLSKTEIEDLLRKGAYAALMDDDASLDESKKFYEEDIDSILQRRSQVITHKDGVEVAQSQAEGSLFSKATFSLGTNNESSLDVNDPEFWDKWAQKAQIDTTAGTEIDDATKLILSDSRRRKVKYGYEDDSDGEGGSVPKKPAKIAREENYVPESQTHVWAKDVEGCTPWLLNDKGHIEKALMAYGFGGWEKIIQSQGRLSTRSINDIKAVQIRLIKWCLEKLRKEREVGSDLSKIEDANEEQAIKIRNRAREDLRAQREDTKMFAEIERAISCVRWETPSVKEVEEMAASGSCQDKFEPFDYQYEEHPELGQYPYPGATYNQLLECRSFVEDCDHAYYNHLEKKPRNLLTRIYMMHFIRQHVLDIDPHAVGELWVAERTYEEKSGHPNENKRVEGWVDKYDALFASKRAVIKFPETYTQIQETLSTTIKNWGFDEDRDLMMGMIRHGYLSFDVIREDTTLIFKQKNFITAEIAKKNLQLAQTCPIWPQGSDIGQRLRKVIAVLGRHVRETKPTTALIAEADSMLNDHCWGKKDRSEYMRAVNAMGIPEFEELETDREEAVKSNYPIVSDKQGQGEDKVIAVRRDWTLFRENCILDHKTDYALEQYARLFVRRAEDFVRTSSDKGLPGDMCVSGRFNGTALPAGVFDQYPAPEVQLIDLTGGPLDPCYGMALERARRLLRRIVFMRTIRAQVLRDPNLDFKLTFAKRSSGLPDWWIPGTFDKAFVQGVARYGMTPLRQNNIMFDPNFPFRPIVEEKLKEANMLDKFESLLKQSTTAKYDAGREVKKVSTTSTGDGDGMEVEEDDDTSASIAGFNLEEVVGWPKDMIRSRRVEIVIDLVLNPSQKAMSMLSYFGAGNNKRKPDDDGADIPTAAFNVSRKVKRIRHSDAASRMEQEHRTTVLSDVDKSVITRAVQQLKDAITFVESHSNSRELVDILKQYVGHDAITLPVPPPPKPQSMDTDKPQY